MAKPKTKTGTEVTVVGQKANLPAFLQDYKGPLGTENIDNADVTIPRLKMAQSLTPEVKDGKLTEGSLFLNVTGQAVWKKGDEEALKVIILAQSKEFILWRPREDNGGGILARAKPVRKDGVTRYRWDKPNQKFEVKVGGKVKTTWTIKEYVDENDIAEWGSEITGDKESGIAATAHHNYAVMLPNGIIAALSMSKSGVKKAKDLNAALKLDNNAPLWGKVFDLSTVEEVGQGGPTERYSNWSIKPAGYVTDQAVFEQAAMIAKGFQSQGFTVDQSDEEQEAGGAEGKGGNKGGSGRV